MIRFTIDRRLLPLAQWEVRQFFASRTNLKCLLLIPPAVFLALWPYVASPFIPVFLAVFIGLEPQYNNILYRTPHEFESLSLFPLDFSVVVLAKNLATAVLTVALAALFAVIVANFSPAQIGWGELGKAGLYLLSVLFPLLMAGNTRSLHAPRRLTGVSLGDAAEAVVTVVIAAVCSIPFLVFVTILGMPEWCMLYAVATGAYWYTSSVRRTAQRIHLQRVRLCQAS
jgi:hypothetical protein